MQAKIRAHAKKDESVFIYAYIAGHGVADVRQYFLLNSSDPQKALYSIEEQLRLRSLAGHGKCFVFAVYDICRINADKLKQLAKEQKEVALKMKKAASLMITSKE